MFTVMFAIGRTVGWVSHWREMITDPNSKSVDQDSCIQARKKETMSQLKIDNMLREAFSKN